MAKRFIILLFLLPLLLSCDENNKEDFLPKLNLVTKEWVNHNHYVLGEAQYDLDTLKAYFKLRGGMSVRYEKKSISLDLGYNYPFNQRTGARRWILNASYIDKTFMRHKIAYDLFKEMDEKNKAPDCSYIWLLRNGNEQGLYVLMKRMTENFLEVAEDGFVFKEPAIFRDSLHELNIKSQKYPERKDSSAYQSLIDFQLFLHNSDQKAFDKAIFDYIDIQSFADWYLLLLFSNNGDGVLKNFYLYKQDRESKIRVAPWDYDHSWGRDGDNEKNMRPNIGEERSVLFKKLLLNKVFCDYLTDRWKKHRSNKVLTLENFKKHIETNHKLIKADLKRNQKIWPLDSSWYFDDNNFEEELEVMCIFVEENLKTMDARFDAKK